MIDLPLDRLIGDRRGATGEGLQGLCRHGAQNPAAKSSPAEVMRSLSNDHPTESQLLDFAKSTSKNIRKFVVSNKIIPIRSEVRPTILETPPYARSGTFASMDTPGSV